MAPPRKVRKLNGYSIPRPPKDENSKSGMSGSQSEKHKESVLTCGKDDKFQVSDLTTVITKKEPASFSTSPPEIRIMIIKSLVNTPRLLCFFPSFSTIPNSIPSLGLNFMAREETKKLINMVPGFGPRNYTDPAYINKPFSYINPKFDTVYCSTFFHCPVPEQVPGIETIAFYIHENAWHYDGHMYKYISARGQFLQNGPIWVPGLDFFKCSFNCKNANEVIAANPRRFEIHLKNFISQLHNLPSLKEILLVRNIDGYDSRNPFQVGKVGRKLAMLWDNEDNKWTHNLDEFKQGDELQKKWLESVPYEIFTNGNMYGRRDRNAYFKNNNTSCKTNDKFRFKRHASGFFEEINAALEDAYDEFFGVADIPVRDPNHASRLVPGFMRTQTMVDSLQAQLEVVNEEMFPGSKLPKFTGVYEGRSDPWQIDNNREKKVREAIFNVHGNEVGREFVGF